MGGGGDDGESHQTVNLAPEA